MSAATAEPTRSVSTRPHQSAWQRIVSVGILTLLVSVAVNLVIDAAAIAVLPISPAFDDLQAPGIIVLTVVGVLGAMLVAALVNRFSRRPVKLYRLIATAALLISCVPDLALLSQPGATLLAVSALIVMHIASYMVCVTLLTTLMRQR